MKNNSVIKSIYVVALVLAMSSFKTIEPLALPTSLKVTVLDEIGNPVEGAFVTLYLTDEDYRAETNPVTITIMTDKKGQVRFKNLKPMAYYMLATFESKSNNGGGVLTQVLEEGKINKVNTVVE